MAVQGSDRLMLNGRQRILFNHPLERVLRDFPSRPRFRIQDASNSQGYVATWEMRSDSSLWLSSLRTQPENEASDLGIRLVFPDSSGPVFAQWVFEELRSPDGDQIRYEHLGYGVRYARETHLHVWAGFLILTEDFDGRTMERTAAEFTSRLEQVFGGEEGAFIRASHARPEDSAPRLIYADWLDERDDPRGTLIRIADRLRDAAPEYKSSEVSRIRALPRPTLPNKSWLLWLRVMGYWDFFATAALAVG